MSGSPRPLNEDLICTLQSEDFAVFKSKLNDSKILIIGEDAEYFVQGKEYTVAFVPVDPGNSVGGAGKSSTAT